MVCECEEPLIEACEDGSGLPGVRPSCFHDHLEQIRRLHGQGDSLLKDLFQEQDFPPFELQAFIDIGAEAEKRNIMVIKELRNELDFIAKENENLLKDNSCKKARLCKLERAAAEREEVIAALSEEVERMAEETAEYCELRRRAVFLEADWKRLAGENHCLRDQLATISASLSRLQQVYQTQTREMCTLKKMLNEEASKVIEGCETIAQLEKDNSLLLNQVVSMKRELKTQCEMFSEKSASYQNLINDLKMKIDHLECDLIKMRQDDSLSKETCWAAMADNECQYEPPQVTKCRDLKELIMKIDERDRTIEKMLEEPPGFISEEEYNSLFCIVEEQNREMCELLEELKGFSNSKSFDIVGELCQLHDEVLQPLMERRESCDILLKKIKRIKCRIKLHIMKVQEKCKEYSKQISLYRCQFYKLQKEIEALKLNCERNSNSWNKIREKIAKEKCLCKEITHMIESKKKLLLKNKCFSKALNNIEKLKGLIMTWSQMLEIT